MIADEMAKRFYDVIDEIRMMGETSISRFYFSAAPSNPFATVELHASSDGSKVAYSGCIYLKFVMKDGDVKVVFVAAKSRVVLA